jgi:hypothetical protein
MRKYVGDCLFQKTFSDSAFNRHVNHGEKGQYMVRITMSQSSAGMTLKLHRHLYHSGQAKKASSKEPTNTRADTPSPARSSAENVAIPSSAGFTAAPATSTRVVLQHPHSGQGSRCSMLFVRDDSLKQAFVTMMNKLVYAHRMLLKPYLEAIKNTSTDDSLRQIQEIQTLLAQNTEKRETLTKLMTQGIIDHILYNNENNKLLSQADSFRSEIEALKNDVSGDVTKVAATTELLHFAEKGEMLTAFDKNLFEKYVRRIVIRSRHEACFELKCGLTLKERM